MAQLAEAIGDAIHPSDLVSERKLCAHRHGRERTTVAGSFQACGAGALRGPGLVNFDLGVLRRFQLGERLSIQFRGEAFNVANTPHFANPNADISASGFGLVSAMQNTRRDRIDQRLFRFRLRLVW